MKDREVWWEEDWSWVGGRQGESGMGGEDGKFLGIVQLDRWF